MRRAHPWFCISLSAMAWLSLSGNASAVDVDVTITPNGPGVQQNQFNDQYFGWNAVLLGTGANQDTRSVWSDSQGLGWVGNPNNSDLGGTDGPTIRCVAHGNIANGGAVLEDRFDTGSFSRVTLTGNFRVKFTNNTVGLGVPVLSAQFSTGTGISLNIGDKDYPAISDHYWYQLVQYKTISSSRRLLLAVEQFPLNGSVTVQEDPNYKTAQIVLDNATNGVQLWWNGVKVYDQIATPFSSGNGDPVNFGVTSNSASWGSDTHVQPLPGQGGSGNENRIYWHSIRIQSLGICSTPSPDANADHDVDMDDFAVFQQCYTGAAPGHPPIPTTASNYPCVCFDRNQDHQIDEADFAEFVNCATGAGVTWSPALKPLCAP